MSSISPTPPEPKATGPSAPGLSEPSSDQREPGLPVSELASLLGQLVRFGAVGVISTIVTLAVIWLLMGILGLNAYLANGGGYVFGIANSYWMNSRFTFKAKRDAGSAKRFLVVAATSFCVNWLALAICLQLIGLNPFIAQGVAMVCYTLTFFTLSRVYAFRD